MTYINYYHLIGQTHTREEAKVEAAEQMVSKTTTNQLPHKCHSLSVIEPERSVFPEYQSSMVENRTPYLFGFE